MNWFVSLLFSLIFFLVSVNVFGEEAAKLASDKHFNSSSDTLSARAKDSILNSGSSIKNIYLAGTLVGGVLVGYEIINFFGGIGDYISDTPQNNGNSGGFWQPANKYPLGIIGLSLIVLGYLGLRNNEKNVPNNQYN